MWQYMWHDNANKVFAQDTRNRIMEEVLIIRAENHAGRMCRQQHEKQDVSGERKKLADLDHPVKTGLSRVKVSEGMQGFPTPLSIAFG